MTTLVCEDLDRSLEQEISFNLDRVSHIEGIKIKLVMFNAPAGTFKLSFLKGVETLASSEFTCDDIKSDLNTTDNYGYIYKALDISLPIKKGDYILSLTATGYTPTSGSYLGWAKSHENIFVNITDEIENFTSNPFDTLIYERTREDLIR